MRHLVTIVMVISVLSGAAVPASALVPVAAAEEYVLLEMSVMTIAGETDGHCFRTAAGTITATLRLEDGYSPVNFSLGRPINLEEPRINTFFGPTPTSYSIPVLDGAYCYGLRNASPASAGIPGPAEVQWVAIRLVWSP